MKTFYEYLTDLKNTIKVKFMVVFLMSVTDWYHLQYLIIIVTSQLIITIYYISFQVAIGIIIYFLMSKIVHMGHIDSDIKISKLIKYLLLISNS